jgi:ABC-2 type transport system ATP-binding protein
VTSAARAVSARGLARRYDDIDAVAGVDLDVEPGEVFGFLGPLAGYLTAEQNLRMHAELYGVAKGAVGDRRRSRVSTYREFRKAD